jgi:hypothetical protein
MISFKTSDTTIRPRRTMISRAVTVSFAALLVAGCTTGGFMSSKSEGTTSSSSGSVPFSDRISSLFGRSSQQESPRAPTTPTTEEFDCPRIDIRQGASTLLVNAGQASGEEGGALTLRYQGSFVRAARECRVTGNMVNIRIGVEGRVILGPAGGPGQVTVPLRFALVSETLNSMKPVWSKLQIINVDIPPQTSNVNFTHIAEDLTVPIPPASELEGWVIYIGFDPSGVQLEQKRRPARQAPPRRAQQQ